MCCICRGSSEPKEVGLLPLRRTQWDTTVNKIINKERRLEDVPPRAAGLQADGHTEGVS